MNSFKIKNLKFKIDQRGLVRFTKKSLITIFTAWIIVVGTGLIYMFNPWVKSVEAVWYDDNWSYRQRVPIDTHTASEDNVYNEISIDTATLTTDKLQADCDDLRFTKENGEVLPYQIVSGCDSATTVINVGFDTMPIAPFNIYMYYGNSTAGAGSSTLIHTACGNGCAEGTLASEEKAPSPVAYWRFDDGTGTNAQDSTVNNNDGTLTNGPTWQTEDQCVAGKCLKFDGTDDYISVSDSNSLNTSNISISGWIKINSWDTTNNTSIYNRRTAANVGGVTLETEASAQGTINFYAYIGGSWRLASSTGWNTNTWYHIAATYDGSTMRLFKNGAQVGTTSISGSINNPSSPSVEIGRNIAGTTKAINGFIDELKIYSYARSAAQIQADYNARASGEGASAVLGMDSGQARMTLSNGLVGYWKMDESSANTCTGGVNDSCDSSGNGNNGAWNGNATSAAGKFGNGTTFDGSGDYTSVADSTIFDSTTMTISAWIYKDSLSSGDYREIFSKVAGGSDRYVLGAYDPTDNKIHAYIDDASNCEVTSDNALTASTWTHVAVSLDGSRHKLYINGALNDDVACTETWSSVGGNISWGAYSTTDDYWNGDFDEARIYNRALSSNEVSQLYNFAPGPVAYYNMEEPSGNLSDKSGNGNTGTATGTTSVNGKYGKARSFGTTDYVSITNASILNPNYVSVNAWVKVNSIGTSYDVVTKATSDDATHSPSYGITITSAGKANFFAFTAMDVAYKDRQSSTTLVANTWYHIAGSWDGTTARIYVNGVDETSAGTTSGSGTGVIDYTYTSPIIFGKRTANPASGINGMIDEIRIYNYAQTAKQIVSDMNAGHPAVGSPIGSAVGHWRFDEGVDNRCSGGTNDACNSGNGGSALDGAISGMASPATSTSGWTQSGKVGRGLVFDGSNDYVLIADNDVLSPATGLTLSSWFNASSFGTNPVLLSKQTLAGGNGDYYLNVSSTGGRFYINTTLLNFSYSFSTSTWYHIITTYDSATTTMKVYINGSQIASTTSAPSSLTNTSAGLYAGTDPNVIGNGNYQFNGRIDEVKVYNYALTADEVKVDMNLGSSQVLGAASNNSSYAVQSANQEYCVPGDSTSCAAPVGRWDFEEGTGITAYDKSGNANNGTLTSGPTWGNGKLGKGLSFDGSDDYVIGSNTSITGDAAFTIQAWFKTNSNSAQQTIVFLGESGTALGAASLFLNPAATGQLSVEFAGSNGYRSASGVYQANTWNHFVATKTPGAINSTTKMYLNGREISSSTSSTNTPSMIAGALRVGQFGPSGLFMNGQIDQVRVFNYARSAAQVAWDYNRGAPVGHWKMDECQGTSIKDWSGNSNHGTLTVGASGTQTSAGTCQGSANTAWKDGVTGKINYSLDFDGTDDYVDLGTNKSALAITGDLTLSSWVKFTNNSTYQMIVAYQTNAATINAYEFRLNGSNGLDFVHANGSTYQSYTSSRTVSPGSWHFVSFTRQGSTYTFYIDGLIAGTGSISLTPTANSSSQGFIGKRTDGYNFSGQIDDVRVYNYALTATQVKDVFNGGAVNFKPVTGAP